MQTQRSLYYPKGVPNEINLVGHSESLGEYLSSAFHKHSDKEAFVCMGVSLSFREVDELSDCLASYFQNVLKLKKGDAVVVQLPNFLQMPIAIYAILKAGLVVVNTNPLYTEKEMLHQFKDSKAKAIIIFASFAHRLESILRQTDIKHVIVTEPGDAFPKVKKHLVNFIVKRVKKMIPSYSIKKAVSWEQVIRAGGLKPFKKVECCSDEVAVLQYTGGTTGVSKGAILTHKNLLSNARQVAAWMEPHKTEEDTAIAALPLYHIFAFTLNMICFGGSGVRNILIPDPRNIGQFVKILKKYRWSVFLGVNTLFQALLRDKNFQNLDFSCLKICISGGAALQSKVNKDWKKVTGMSISEGYGLTEASPVVCCNKIDDNQEGSIGFTLPSTQVRILKDDGELAHLGEIGELIVYGPQVMKGYWMQPEENKNIFTSDGGLKTGDIGYIDEKGYVYISDRKKDIILVSGFNVFPNEVEDVVINHPEVLEAAVVGIPDSRSGEAVKLHVVRKNDQLTEESIKVFCKKYLTNYKVPRIVEFHDSLPKSNVGKVLRKELKLYNQKKH